MMTGGGGAMLRDDTIARDLLAELIRGAVDDTVRQQMMRRAQEPQISSKIATTIEGRLNGALLGRYRVTAVVQDFTDRGPKSGEWHSGSDLYLGLRVDNGVEPPRAKGMLIQAKKRQLALRGKDGAINPRVGKGHLDLLKQCEKMLKRTVPNGAFVWLYSANGTEVLPAREVLDNPQRLAESLNPRGVADQFREVLDCFQGDPDLVGRGIFDDDGALADFMGEIAVARAVTIDVAPHD